MKLLIIDDNPKITNMLQEFLEISGFKVTIANDGKHGLELIQKEDYDKILMDISMPGFGGHDIIQNLKKTDFTDFNKIIILSATSLNQEITEEIMNCGINSMLEKPIAMDELVEKLKN